MVLCIPCGPICSSQPLSFCFVAMFEASITGSIIFWDEMGASWIIEVALKWIIGILINEEADCVLGVCVFQVNKTPRNRAHRGISFHAGVRGCAEMGVINLQFNAAPNTIAFSVNNIIGIEHDSSLSFRYPMGWERIGDHNTATINRIE